MHSRTYGPATIAKIEDLAEIRQLLVDPLLNAETVVIKPNWVSTEAADFTDARTLRAVIEAIDSRIVIVESYMLLRSMNLYPGGKSFDVGDKEVNWQWLLKGDGWRWLIENPHWSWFKESGHWDQIREEDAFFLDKFGFSDLFDEYDVSYINITEEVWNGRIADPEEVKRLVEARFTPVSSEQLYRMVPAALVELRGSTFVSLAKLKSYASLTVKNLFGLIPDPLRPAWHGRNNLASTANIVDINKIVHALFNVFGICEALHETAVPHPEGQYQGVYTGRYNLVPGPDVLVFGRDLVFIDALILKLTEGLITVSPPLNQAPLDLAASEFGTIDRDALAAAQNEIGNLFDF